MSTDPLVLPDYESLDQAAAALGGMMARLRILLGMDALTEDAFVEICAIYNNVAYVFLYLESNEAHINYDRVLPWRSPLYRRPKCSAGVLHRRLALPRAPALTDAAPTAFIPHHARPLV